MEIPAQLRPYAARPAAVFGWGVSGQAAGGLLRAAGFTYETYDEKVAEGVNTEFRVEDAQRHGLIVYSPGFRQNHPWLLRARSAGCCCLGEMDFASLFWKGAVIGVTGTNGKTTLTDFLAFALRRNGMDAVAAGNIGYPLSKLHELTRTQRMFAVCETSSFQSEDLNHMRPHAVLWTNFDEDHLDRYTSLREYFLAKWKLIQRLTRPRLVVGSSVAQFAADFGLSLPSYAVIVTRADAHLIPPGSCFCTYPQQENYLIARQFWLMEGFPLKVLEEAAGVFAPRRHRLVKVADIGELSFWNDSKATNFHAVYAALEEFPEPVYWIGGGKPKGGDIPGFIGKIAPRVREAFLIGETGPSLVTLFENHGVPATLYPSMQDAVFAAAQKTQGKGVVLFSPGFASFDMFQNYADRGTAFERAVLSLKASPSENR